MINQPLYLVSNRLLLMFFNFIQSPNILLFIGLSLHSLRSQYFYICKDIISLN